MARPPFSPGDWTGLPAFLRAAQTDGRLTAWEREFVRTILFSAERGYVRFTAKQWVVINRLAAVCGALEAGPPIEERIACLREVVECRGLRLVLRGHRVAVTCDGVAVLGPTTLAAAETWLEGLLAAEGRLP